MTELKSLQNHFLVAMPSLDDPYFSRSLTYICEHNKAVSYTHLTLPTKRIV